MATSSLAPAELKAFLKKNEIPFDEKVLVAFSGGADSLALLVAFSEIGMVADAIYINHHLRSEQELSHEIELNKKNADSLHFFLRIIDLDSDELKRLSSKGGVEYAARVLRYRELQNYASSNGIKHIFTGHNRDDDDEEEIIRFFRGNTGFISIKPVNGMICRPFLKLSHKDLVSYISAKGFLYSVDSTNFSRENLRSQIRLSLIPHLEEVFPSFSRSMLERRISLESNAQEGLDNKIFEAFSLIRMSNSNNGRVSRRDVNRIIDFEIKGNSSGKIEYADAVIFRQSGRLVISRKGVLDNRFSFTIESGSSGEIDGLYSLSSFTVCNSKAKLISKKLPPLSALLPFSHVTIRSAKDNDEIFIRGRNINIFSLFKKCGISSEFRKAVPLVEYEGKTVAVIMGPFGKENYFKDDLFDFADGVESEKRLMLLLFKPLFSFV